ncbi:MAG: thiamine pyrophosphate-dependent enzyme [Clostridia bacterium]|nr:thiamine pyrophosphate-dependent enzyme [Clostridia bacterium]
MMISYNIPEEKVFLSGHNACPGCGEALALRYILNTLGPETVGVVPPSCIAIISGPQPYSSMRIPVYQTTLEASAASAAGIKRALDVQGKTQVNVVALAGDGGTYDIGFQALSAAAERNEDIIYICLDNEGYMNTGAQKSSATPWLAYTTSTPGGKPTGKKNVAEIMAAHEIPYVATATVGFPDDLTAKIRKAKEMKGMRFIVVLTPCLAGWGVPDSQAVRVSRLAVDTGIFPLYEVENGRKYTLNWEPRGIPVDTYLRTQSRYKHLTADQIEEIQQEVNRNMTYLREKQ